jgi:hypothetical protein
VASAHQIMNVMEHQAGGHDKLGFIPRDFYNFVAEYMKKKIEGRDAEYMGCSTLWPHRKRRMQIFSIDITLTRKTI